ncbi:MAG: carboxypeptidase-like regulatory domain-containing protein, partial [candidate division KSB1 bacterium]|nr:carboxypeptidase-like regulatory domain-containing protein [candidate division KSB1 bacterium]
MRFLFKRFCQWGTGLVLTMLGLGINVLPALGQTGTISGTVKANDTGEPLIGANVVIVNTSLGSATNTNGQFEIQQVPPGQYTVKAVFIGYHSMIQEVRLNAGETVTVNFDLEPSTVMGEEIVVSASRRVEKLTEAPATIMVVNADEIARTTAFTYGDALVKAKGVDIYRTGIDGVGINARGFMTAYSYRMQLMADGKNAMLPGAGLAAGNILPVPKEDIARIETILGPASALYGPNAHNGLVNVVTKHPRDYPGTTIAFGGGQNAILTGRLRHAQIVNDKLAFKVNAEYLKGQNWTKNDTVGYDNSGKAYLENPDHGILNFRTLAALYYNFTPEIELMIEGGYSVTNSIGSTNVGRNQILGWKYDHETIRLSSPHFFIQFYRTGNDAGRTHAIGNKVAMLIAMANAGVSMTEDEAIDKVKYI